jgi:hypothetical protein
VKVLAEIPARSSSDLRPGALRRRDLEVFDGLLGELRGARCVLVTGAAPAMLTAAIGLATAATVAGVRTALLECDLAEPALADALGLASAPGLHEHLRGTAEASEILLPVVLAGPAAAGVAEPLVCVVAGRPSQEGQRLFASEAIGRALAGLRASHELLVVVGPRLEEWGSLSLLWPYADATIACLGRAESRRSLPFPVAGIVIQG